MAQVRVTYNGKTVTYDGTKTLTTQGKLMSSDITLVPIAGSGDLQALLTIDPNAQGFDPEADQHFSPTGGKIGFEEVDYVGITNTYVGSSVTPGDGSAATWSYDAGTGTHSDDIEVEAVIPAGYYPQDVTISYTITNFLPPLDPDADSAKILLGYEAYDENGQAIVGTMPNHGSSTLTITAADDGVITIGEGYYDGTGSVSAVAGTVKSGAATIADPVYDGSSKFVQTVSVAAPTAESAGWISATKGTKQTNNVTSKELDKISIGLDLSGETLTVKPVIAKQAVSGAVDASNGAATSTVVAGKPYVAVNTSAVAASATVSAVVKSAGYGTTTTYDADAASAITAGAQAADTAYIAIKEGLYDTTGSVSGNITLNAPVWNASNSNYDYSASDSISGSAVTTVRVAGWVDADSETYALSGSANQSSTLNKLAITTTGGSSSLTPTIAREAFSDSRLVDGAGGAAVTTKPSDGVYIKVSTAADSDVVAVTSTANTGYSDGTHYDSTGANVNVVLNGNTAYVPVATVTLATPTIATSNTTNSSASGLFIGTVSTNAVVRVTATETQAAGWTSGTEAATLDIPVFVGDFV